MSYFLVKAQYNAQSENGKDDRVTRLSLIDGILYGEVEQRAIEEIRPFTNDNDVFIADIKRYNIQELIDNGGDTLYRMQVLYITLDEQTGKEKEVKHYYLVNADDMDTAKGHLEEFMKDTLGDWKIGKIETTKIMDIFV